MNKVINNRFFLKKLVYLMLFVMFFLLNANIILAQETQEQDKEILEYCESGDICTSPPSEFANYVSFSKEILGKINFIGTKGSKLGKYVKPNLFQRGVFEFPEDNYNILAKMYKGIRDNILQKLTTMRAMGVVLLSVAGLSTQDYSVGILVLFYPKPWVTAWKQLMDIDDMVHDYVLNLGIANGWDQKISETNREDLQETFDEYSQGSAKIFDKVELKEGIRYKHIVILIRNMNRKFKTFIGSKGIIDWALKKDIEKGNNSKLIVKISKKWSENLFAKYGCIAGMKGLGKCDDKYKRFIDKFKNLGDEVDVPIKRIKDANKNLLSAFKVAYKQLTTVVGDDVNYTKEEKEFLNYEKELLESVYGFDTQRIIDGGLLGTKSLLEGINEFGGSVSNYRSIVTQGIDKVGSMISSLFAGKNKKKDKEDKEDEKKDNNQEEKEKKKDFEKLLKYCFLKNEVIIDKIKEIFEEYNIEEKDYNTCGSLNMFYSMYVGDELLLNNDTKEDSDIITNKVFGKMEQYDKKVKDILFNNLNNLLEDQKKHETTFSLSSNKDLTIYFVLIKQQIEQIKAILGNKDKGIIYELGEACMGQCQNKSKKCFY